MRSLVQLLVALLPSSRVKIALLNHLGHHVHASARISPILLFPGARLTVAAGATIGTLSAFRAVRVTLAEQAELGQLNWVSAAPFLVESTLRPGAGTFSLGPSSSFTNRHYVDASGGMTVGAYATVAGVRSVFMTHGIDVETSVLGVDGIEIGAYSMVGSTVKMVPGSAVPSYSVIGMGSTITPGLTESYHLYAGAPARAKKRLAEDSRYFTREHGPVLPLALDPARAGDDAVLGDASEAHDDHGVLAERPT